MAGELVAYDGTDTIRLVEGPCTSQTVLSHVDASIQSEFRAAAVVLKGQKYEACWRPLPTAAHLVYEDGDQGIVPVSMLNQTVEI